MQFIILALAFLAAFYFLFVTARQAQRESRYYEWIADQDETYYQELEKSASSPVRSSFHE
jgi:hypothetical protein